VTGEVIEALEPNRRTNLKFLCGYLALGNTLILTVLTSSEIKPSPCVFGLFRGQEAHRAQKEQGQVHVKSIKINGKDFYNKIFIMIIHENS